jgi:hypothetical protein
MNSEAATRNFTSRQSILLVKYGSFSHVNVRVEAMLRKEFPEYNLEVVDAARIVEDDVRVEDEELGPGIPHDGSLWRMVATEPDATDGSPNGHRQGMPFFGRMAAGR